MDPQDNPESPYQDIEFLEDDIEEIVDLDDESGVIEGKNQNFTWSTFEISFSLNTISL